MTTAWFDNERGRMRPDELQTVIFPTSRLGRRGYEEGPVRDFLAAVQAEFVRLVNERTSLWQEVQRLRRRIIAGETEGAGDEQSVLFGAEDAHVHAVRILSTAQVTAEKYVADARDYSSRLTKETRQRRDEIMQQARQHSSRLLEEAQVKARDAAVSALDGPASPPSDEEWQAAQAELAYLRTYSGVYRAHLRAYTEGILRGIEEWERKESDSIEEIAQRGPVATPSPRSPISPSVPAGRPAPASPAQAINGHRNGNGSAYLRH
ncbi:MAG: DivIVA domain-containing protein [Actinobacteria bacterium]|nr:DivIVA domain-containing protein [Actinomycetota bacterium]